jgi:hypothetical protein
MISIERAEVNALGVPVQLQGSLALRPVLSGDLRLSTPPGHPPSCGPLLAAQAAPVRETLAGMALQGHLGIALSLVFDAAAWEELGGTLPPSGPRDLSGGTRSRGRPSCGIHRRRQLPTEVDG